MKKIILAVLAIGSAWVIAGAAAHAEQGNDVLARLTALEKENAAIRKENAALRENKTLRQQNATLKSSAPPQAATQAAPEPGAKRADPFGAYAADLPLAYKAPVAETRGQFRVWGEGGAIFSGGDPISRDYTLTDFTSVAAIFGGGLPGSFDLTPKVGWKQRLALTIALQVHPGMSAVSSVTAKAKTPASYRRQARSIQPFSHCLAGRPVAAAAAANRFEPPTRKRIGWPMSRSDGT